MQRGNWIAIRSSETSSVRSRTTLAAGCVLCILYFVHLLVLGTCSNVAPKYQVDMFPIKISSIAELQDTGTTQVLCYVKMIFSFQADPSTEYRVSLVERVVD